MEEIEPLDHNPTEGFVSGYWYKASILGSDDFDFWVPRKLSRKELYPVALKYANYGGAEYDRDCIDFVRKIS